MLFGSHPEIRNMLWLNLLHLFITLMKCLAKAAEYLFWALAPNSAQAGEIVSLKTELATYRSRNIRPRRFTDGARLTFVWLTRRFDLSYIIHVQRATLARWHRHAFRLFWRWKSRRRGRPPIPKNLRKLIRQVIGDNKRIGQRQVADILLRSFNLLVSPRAVAKYWPRRVDPGKGQPVGSWTWLKFVHKRARANAIVACDFFTVVTATFRTLFVLVMMELGSRKIIHYNVTAHPTAEWTAQQFREALSPDCNYKTLIHDHGSAFTKEVDEVAEAVGIEVKKTPFQAPKANAYCERLIGTIRRECLDYLIAFGEGHLKLILNEWVDYYNQWRPHRGQHPDGVPRIPEPIGPPPPPALGRHQIADGYEIEATPILGGLRHRYRLKKVA
jgi:transposase InsO family protein